MQPRTDLQGQLHRLDGLTGEAAQAVHHFADRLVEVEEGVDHRHVPLLAGRRRGDDLGRLADSGQLEEPRSLSGIS